MYVRVNIMKPLHPLHLLLSILLHPLLHPIPMVLSRLVQLLLAQLLLLKGGVLDRYMPSLFHPRALQHPLQPGIQMREVINRHARPVYHHHRY
jgi:hypothetical protein